MICSKMLTLSGEERGEVRCGRDIKITLRLLSDKEK